MKHQTRNLSAWLGVVALFGFLLTACESEDTPVTGLITFEDVGLDSTGYKNGSDLTGTHSSYEAWWGGMVDEYAGYYSSGIGNFYTVFDDYGYGSTSWKGIACSNHTNMDSIGYGNQYSVYAANAANGSANFGLVNTDSAKCAFSVPVTVDYLMITNSTYVYLTLVEGKDGAGFARKFEQNDYFKVTVTGLNENGLKTGSVDYYLADYRNESRFVCSTWTKLPLTELGVVKTLVFTFISTDSGENGINTPAYTCIDNIAYTVQ